MAIRDASHPPDLRVRTGLHAGRYTLKGIPREWELLVAGHDPAVTETIVS
jgi:hypothetical protein